MPYTVGNKRIILSEDLSESDQKLLLKHSKVFRYCLNNACIKFLLNLKKIIHLYSDIMIIYSTLLNKIPHYDDITHMTSRCKTNLLRLEDDFNDFFGHGIRNAYDSSCDNSDEHKFDLVANWCDQNYEKGMKPGFQLWLKASMAMFEQIDKTLLCIELFFSSYTNLKKLLIPFLKEQTSSLQHSLKLVDHYLQVPLIVDDISKNEYDQQVFQNLKEIEKITSGIEKEAGNLNTAFVTFDGSLSMYTNILLGKAILKRYIESRYCQLIKRREICCQASERVVSIPLTEDKPCYNPSMKFLGKTLTYFVMAIMMLVIIVFYRFYKIIFET
ncbi:hypothetical protein KGF56_001677 [Candida oxycetoniae]|uniref:Uncharacterized protein n=1 Tax=Candida oxycetoniae TaxID=497107 RepID=A0AAI9SZ78_9ASCO|nr:uncharacterized protein KGF56_001677 [Candida oxycetoniae]KAI3405659.1 hypothetical protein KGF56_001677 [Candida oxycetoniae]